MTGVGVPGLVKELEVDRQRVDTRLMRRTGQYRLRFRLTDDAMCIVTEALSLTGYSDTGVALDAIAMNSLAGSPAVAGDGNPVVGRARWLAKLFPDQYQVVRDALDHAGEFSSDADALVYICRQFIVAHGPMIATESVA